MCSTFISEASNNSSEYLYVNENSQPMTDKTVNWRAACLDNKLIFLITKISRFFKYVTNLNLLSGDMDQITFLLVPKTSDTST